MQVHEVSSKSSLSDGTPFNTWLPQDKCPECNFLAEKVQILEKKLRIFESKLSSLVEE